MMNGYRSNDPFSRPDPFGRAGGPDYGATLRPVTGPGTVDTPAEKHSRLGIASFAAAIAAAVAFLCAVAAVGIAVAIDKTANKTADKVLMVMFFTTGILGSLVAVFGLALGVANLFQSQRKKIFGILGTVVNGVFVLGVFGCVFLGFVMTLLKR